jgi:hypothetical protein
LAPETVLKALSNQIAANHQFSYFETKTLFIIAILLIGFFVKQNGQWLLAL